MHSALPLPGICPLSFANAALAFLTQCVCMGNPYLADSAATFLVAHGACRRSGGGSLRLWSEGRVQHCAEGTMGPQWGFVLIACTNCVCHQRLIWVGKQDVLAPHLSRLPWQSTGRLVHGSAPWHRAVGGREVSAPHSSQHPPVPALCSQYSRLQPCSRNAPRQRGRTLHPQTGPDAPSQTPPLLPHGDAAATSSDMGKPHLMVPWHGCTWAHGTWQLASCSRALLALCCFDAWVMPQLDVKETK